METNDRREAPPVIVPRVIKTSKIWLKDSSGYPSISVTMLAISFWVTTVAYVLSIVSKIGPLDIRPFDVGACGAYFGMILGTYVARRATEAKWGNPNVPTDVQPDPIANGPMPPATVEGAQ